MLKEALFEWVKTIERWQAVLMELGRRFLLTEAARQLGLTATLHRDERATKSIGLR